MGEFTEGDGNRQSYDLTIGTSDDRFSAMFGMSYVKEDQVMAGDREISREPIFRTGTSLGSSTTPGGRFAVCNGTFANACARVRRPARRQQWPVHLQPGQFRQRMAQLHPAADLAERHLQLRAGQLPDHAAGAQVAVRSRLAEPDRQHPRLHHRYVQQRRSEQLLAAMPIVPRHARAPSRARSRSAPTTSTTPFGRDRQPHPAPPWKPAVVRSTRTSIPSASTVASKARSNWVTATSPGTPAWCMAATTRTIRPTACSTCSPCVGPRPVDAGQWHPDLRHDRRQCRDRDRRLRAAEPARCPGHDHARNAGFLQLRRPR